MWKNAIKFSLNILFIAISLIAKAQSTPDSLLYNKALHLSNSYSFKLSNQILATANNEVDKKNTNSPAANRIKLFNLLGYNHFRLYDLNKAKNFFLNAVKLSEITPPTSSKSKVRSLLGLANIAALEHKADSLYYYTNLALKEIEDNDLQEQLAAECYLNLGKHNWLIGGASTEIFFAKAANLLHDDALTDLYVWSSNFYAEQNRLDTAKFLAQKAIKLSSYHGKIDTIRIIQANMLLGYLHHRQGNLKEAINIYTKNVLERLNNNENEYLRSEVYRLIGYAFNRLGDYKNSLHYDIENLTYKLSYHGKNHFKTAEAYMRIAYTYGRMNLPEKTINYLEQAIQIFKDLNNINNVYSCYYLLMKTYIQNGNYDKASIYINELLQNKRSESASYYYQSLIYIQKNSFDKAKKSILDSRNASIKAKERDIIFYSQQRNLEARILSKLGKTDSAMNLYKETFEKIISSGRIEHVVTVETINQYIESLLLCNQLNLLPELLEQAISLNTKSKGGENHSYSNTLYVQELVVTLNLKANYLLKIDNEEIGSLQKANKIYSDCRKLILESRGTYNTQIDRIYQQQLYISIFQESVKLLIKLYQKTQNSVFLNEALQVVELTKSSVLLQGIQSNQALKFHQIPDSIITQEASLKKQLSYLQSQLVKRSEEDESEQTRVFKDELFNKNKVYEELILFLEKNYPEYYNVKYNTDVFSIPDAQKKLQVDEALIEYFNTEDQTYVFTLTRDTLYHNVINSLNKHSIEAFRNSLSYDFKKNDLKKIYDSYATSAYRIYTQTLQKPLKHLDAIKIKSLRIVPDGLLNLIPFENMITSPSSDVSGNYSKLPYLFKKYNISYGYSANSIFKFSNHTHSDKENRLLSMAPSRAVRTQDTQSLSPLKWNHQEANNIMHYINGSSLTGSQATELDFKNRVSEHNIAHLAMHAVVDNENPMYSKLLFSPPNDTIEDGMLHAFELYNMNINTDMTVLSACNTGSGKLVSGEGVMSLSRAFAYAGCPSIVMSHWAVDDKTTSQLMGYFYKRLSDGEAKDEALRKAKLDFLENSSPAYHHPYYWNNFVIIGDDRPIIQYSFSWLWIVGVILLIFILTYYIYKQNHVIKNY